MGGYSGGGHMIGKILLASAALLISGTVSGAPIGAPNDQAVIDMLLRSVKSYSCSGKTKCAQMDSCEEAYFYLRQCGVRRLDGDGDGVPCESICG